MHFYTPIRYTGEGEEVEINRHDVVPFYEKYGFSIDLNFLIAHQKYVPKGTVPMVVSKSLLRERMCNVKNNDLKNLKFSTWIYTHSIK